VRKCNPSETLSLVQTGALDEVEWLRSRLEQLETSLIARAGEAVATRPSIDVLGTSDGPGPEPPTFNESRAPDVTLDSPSVVQSPGTESRLSSPPRGPPINTSSGQASPPVMDNAGDNGRPSDPDIPNAI
jgi:hypothetical protein